MWSKEKELLRRALVALDANEIEPHSALQEEILNYLASEEETHNTQSVHPKQKPLGLTETQAKWLEYTETVGKSVSPRQAFRAGIRAAEQHYGISETTLSLNDTISANSQSEGL